MARNTIATAADKADFFKRLNATTKRVNPVTGERYEAPRLRDTLAREVAAQLTANSPSPCPATPPAGRAGQL